MLDIDSLIVTQGAVKITELHGDYKWAIKKLQ